MIGAVSANADAWQALTDTHHALGHCVGPDDVYLTQRGIRTLGIRVVQGRDFVPEDGTPEPPPEHLYTDVLVDTTSDDLTASGTSGN